MYHSLKRLVQSLLPNFTKARSHPPVPADLEEDVHMPELPKVRDWGDRPSLILRKSLAESWQQELLYEKENPDKGRSKQDVLVLSGGSDNGAFGAGLLCGWTEHGDRPVFKVVTGFSTGALLSIPAFLGSEYDELLKTLFTTVSAKDIFRVKNIFSILTSESIVDSRPLADSLERYFDEGILAALAEQYRRGRRLFICTTQFSSQRLVVWDIGAIAASQHPGALALLKKITLASAALPGIFPPAHFEVTAGGHTYEEIHVDGALGMESLTYEFAIEPLISGCPMNSQGRRLFIIRNGVFRPEWQEVKAKTLAILPLALVTLIKNQVMGDLYRLYHEASRNGFEYNLACIPDEIQVEKREKFDTTFMKQLFSLGYSMSRQGYPWAHKPPRWRSDDDQN
jgi:Patatin-like phospholipase